MTTPSPSSSRGPLLNRLLKIVPCLVSLLLPLAAQAETQPAAPAAAGTVPRIATVDWTIAETLLALGVTPLAMGDVNSYRAWVGEPRLPAEVIDIGLRAQPNRELLAELKPDLILISPLAAPLAPTLSRIAPVLRGRMEKVAFEFDAKAPVTRQVEQVLAAVARGQVAPDVGKQIIDAVRSFNG